jgi:hypothetical protein
MKVDSFRSEKLRKMERIGIGRIQRNEFVRRNINTESETDGIETVQEFNANGRRWMAVKNV